MQASAHLVVSLTYFGVSPWSILVPDQIKMEKRAGRIIQEFKDLVFPADYVPGAKRKVIIPFLSVEQ